MKQALPSEMPARVRRGQLRAITLGFGASVLAMACSFGEIDNDPGIDDDEGDVSANNDPSNTPDDNNADPGTPGGAVNTPSNGGTVNTPPADPAKPYDPDADPFSTEQGKVVADILRVNCGNCHIGAGAQAGFGYLLDIEELMASGKVIPGSKEDSRIYARMVEGTMPPAAVRVIQTPTYGQIELVGRWIDELADSGLVDEGVQCDAPEFMDMDAQIRLMNADMAAQEVEDQPFTRYLTITYASNAGLCGRPLQRQRYALFKGINSVSTNTVVTQPVAIDQDELIYRIDIRDYNWDRDIDLEDDGVVDFTDGWEAIIANPETSAYAVEYTGTQADQLKADAGTTVPFMSVNTFIQASEFGALYYTLIGAKENLFVFEREVLGIDTAVEIADDNLLRAGFSNSGVSKQERVLNRFDSNLGPGTSYWISFDFDGGLGNGDVGGVTNGFEINVANESIFANPLDFAFAGGEAIFSLPNGLQAYYVAKADGGRLDTAPIGVVIDPAQNNGLVTNGASCHSCHNAGMITFTDEVRQYVEDNKFDFDNETYESVMEQYVDAKTFQAAMDADSRMHVNALERAGVPAQTPDAVSRTYLDFQLGNIDLATAAGELAIPAEALLRNVNQLDPRLGNLAIADGHVDRNIMDATFLDAICTLQAIQENQPLNCQ